MMNRPTVRFWLVWVQFLAIVFSSAHGDSTWVPLVDGTLLEYRYQRWLDVGGAASFYNGEHGVEKIMITEVRKSADTIRFTTRIVDSNWVEHIVCLICDKPFMTDTVMESSQDWIITRNSTRVSQRGGLARDTAFMTYQELSSRPVLRGYPMLAYPSESEYCSTDKVCRHNRIGKDLLRVHYEGSQSRDTTSWDTTYHLAGKGPIFSNRYAGVGIRMVNESYEIASENYVLTSVNGVPFILEEHLQLDPVVVNRRLLRSRKNTSSPLAGAPMYDLRGRLHYFPARPSIGRPSNRARYSP